MLRIFLTSSHFSTALMTSYANSTADHSTRDYLILDGGPRKSETINQIKVTAGIHEWKDVLDFSIVLTDQEQLPDLRKRITRRLKNIPGFRPIYKFLYKRHDTKVHAILEIEVLKRIKEVVPGEQVQLFMLKETMLNKTLEKLFKSAEVNYFEHGLSDYLINYTQPPNGKGKYFCVFANEFKTFIKKNNLNADFVEQFSGTEYFENICKSYFIHQQKQSEKLKAVCAPEKEYALIILQPFENLQLDSQKCWEGFFNKVFSKTNTSTHYLIKSHPSQSLKELGYIKTILDQTNKSYSILDTDSSAVCIEIGFYLWKDKIKSVFSPYSSAVFYLSLLYPQKDIQYYYAYEYMRPFMASIPKHFSKLFLQAAPMIREVFSKNCKEI